VVKSQRVTEANGAVSTAIELDPWGGETDRSWQQYQQPQRFTSYLRDGNESDEAMMRRYNRWWSRFDQPDPYDGSYNLADPQSLNRYSYVQNDPVNYVDPTGLLPSFRDIFNWLTKGHEGPISFAGPPDAGPSKYGWWDYYRGDEYVYEEMQNSTPTPAPTPDPAEIERLIKSCLQNISIVPQDIYNAIRDNKRDVQSLVLSLAHAATESSFLPNAVGRQGELGLFQLKLSTANSLGLGTFTRNQMFDPALNTQAGTTYLQNLVNSFNGDVRTALGAYKQGPTSVRENGLSKASQEYADGILGCERKILGR